MNFLVHVRQHQTLHSESRYNFRQGIKEQHVKNKSKTEYIIAIYFPFFNNRILSWIPSDFCREINIFIRPYI